MDLLQGAGTSKLCALGLLPLSLMALALDVAVPSQEGIVMHDDSAIVFVGLLVGGDLLVRHL